MTRLLRWLFPPRDTGSHVSTDCLRHHLRAEMAQGWIDGPAWLSPKEIRALHRAERRQASKLRMVGR